MVIDTIPESIPRGAAMAVLRELGFDPNKLISLELNRDGIRAETFAEDAAGRKIIDHAQGQLVTNKVFIRFD